jgi:putative YhdH/YhfP family quinone oxidoreductase
MTEQVPETFRAFRIHNDDEGYRAGIENISLDDLDDGNVTIRVHHSDINFKDALAGTGKGKILRRYPMCGGIDAAGTVVMSESNDFTPGQEVLITGSGLSETRDGGYTEYLRVESASLISLPDGLSLFESMVIGTAGFTAAMSLYRMEVNGQKPEHGPIVVTGATGGVGTMAIDILSGAGYEVHAISGKKEQFGWLESLGASQCFSRHELEWGGRSLESARWAGCVDSVGGDMLSGIAAAIKPWGNIASCGLAGGIKLNTTVMPFIIRGVSLLGIDSPQCPTEIRKKIWPRLGSTWKPRHLDKICQQRVSLDEMVPVFNQMMTGASLGRVVVDL